MSYADSHDRIRQSHAFDTDAAFDDVSLDAAASRYAAMLLRLAVCTTFGDIMTEE